MLPQFPGWDSSIYAWILLITLGDLIAGISLLWAEYKWFKPLDTKSMAKQVKKLLAEQLSKKEAKQVMKKIDKAITSATEEEKE